MPMTLIGGLGYAGFGSNALDDWRQFGTQLLGLQAVERGNNLLAFRMDDHKQRIVIDRALGNGTRFFGWEVVDGAALDALAARLEAAGVAVTAEPQALVDARRVRRLISFSDPAGGWRRFSAPRSTRRHSGPAATFPVSAPARSGLAMPC